MIVDAAAQQVKQAQDSQRGAQHDLDAAGRFGRHRARVHVADADARLAETTQTLEAAQDQARPTRETRAAARTNLAAARRDYDSHHQIERWSYHPERLEAIEHRIDALDGWRDWAEGKAITDRTVIDVVHGLGNEARNDDRGVYTVLADVTLRWAQAKGLDLSRTTPTIERAGIEIGLQHDEAPTSSGRYYSALPATSDPGDCDARHPQRVRLQESGPPVVGGHVPLRIDGHLNSVSDPFHGSRIGAYHHVCPRSTRLLE